MTVYLYIFRCDAPVEAAAAVDFAAGAISDANAVAATKDFVRHCPSNRNPSCFWSVSLASSAWLARRWACLRAWREALPAESTAACRPTSNKTHFDTAFSNVVLANKAEIRVY